MEQLINEKNYEEPLYELIGKEHQILQLILMPNQRIVTRKSSVLYMSDGINLADKLGTKERIKQFITGEKAMNVDVENTSASIGYVGLSFNKGRIIIINPFLTQKLVIKESYILAHTSNLDLLPHSSVDYKLLNPGDKEHTKMLVEKAPAEPTKEENKIFDDLDNSQEQKGDEGFLFLHAHENFIEKRLGVDEQIQIRPECLVAYSESIKFSKSPNQRGPRPFMITLKGPGFVYIETQNISTIKGRAIPDTLLIL